MRIMTLAIVGLLLAGMAVVFAQSDDLPNITLSPNMTNNDTLLNESDEEINESLNTSNGDIPVNVSAPNVSINRTPTFEIENKTIIVPVIETKQLINETDTVVIITELDRSVDTPVTAVSQANVLSGTGWALRSEYGTFIEVVLVERVFVDQTGNEYILTYGLIRTDRGDEIFIYQDSRDRNFDEFQIREGGRTTGRFILDREQNRGAFTVWEGDVRFTTGEEGYELEFGTSPQFVEETATAIVVDRSLNTRLENRRRVSLTLGERLRDLFRRNR